MKRSMLSSRATRFLIVGVSNTLISFAVFQLLFGLFGVAAISQAIAYAAGVCWSFAWNSRWTFGQAAFSKAQFVRFVFSQIMLLGLSATVLGVAVDRFGLNATACWVATTAVVTVINYAIARAWVFAAKQDGRTNDT